LAATQLWLIREKSKVERQIDFYCREDLRSALEAALINAAFPASCGNEVDGTSASHFVRVLD